MWIVRLAIDRPYTFVVVALLLALISGLAAKNMAVDIFPNINIPVVSVIWSFTGLSPEEMESRIISVSERAMTVVTSNIEHMESVSISGIGIIRVFLHQGADMGQAVSLMSAINQSELINMPPGITPPAVVSFSATDVPVLQLGVSSKILTEAQLYDYDLNFIRTRLATVGGASLPLPYGGKQRQVMVDLYPNKLLSKGVSPNDVVAALGTQNIILPAGVARLGSKEFPVRINGSPQKMDTFNNIPIKRVNNATIYIRDIGYAHDGYSIQTNIVRMDGKRGTMLNVLRSGGASTLSVVKGIIDTLPLVKATLPKSLDIRVVNDQSEFVRGAITQVIREAGTAALLTGLLMLALLGSWRSTLIVAISIPLSIMTSIIALGATGQTLNTMTLGGLSLAVGMLVDDATVEVENIHRNLDLGLPLREAVLVSAAQVALPALVSTISICIVFIPVVLLTEPSRSLFVPLGMAVVFAMLASYFLSRTLVPVMSVFLLKSEQIPGARLPEGLTEEEAVKRQAHAAFGEELDKRKEKRAKRPAARKGVLEPVQAWVDDRFNNMRDRYHGLLELSLERKGVTVIAFSLFYLLSFCLLPFIGKDFFPAIDAGQMRLHLVCPVGTRVDETEKFFSRVETAVRRIIPRNEIASIIENMGTPSNGLSLCYGDNTNYTEFDGEMLITLNRGQHGSTFEYEKRIRNMLARDFPMLTYYFQPADITTQILNAGLQAPIDVQVTGPGHREDNYAVAKAIDREVSLIPGAVDVLVRQSLHQPQINVNVNRAKAIELALTQQDVAASLLTSLSSSFQTSPSFWVNPETGVNYSVSVQTPLYKIRSIDDIMRTLITGTGGLLAVTTANPRGGGAVGAAAMPSVPAQPLTLAESTPTVQPAPGTERVISSPIPVTQTQAYQLAQITAASQPAFLPASAILVSPSPNASTPTVAPVKPLPVVPSVGSVIGLTTPSILPSSANSANANNANQSTFTPASTLAATAVTTPSPTAPTMLTYPSILAPPTYLASSFDLSSIVTIPQSSTSTQQAVPRQLSLPNQPVPSVSAVTALTNPSITNVDLPAGINSNYVLSESQTINSNNSGLTVANTPAALPGQTQLPGQNLQPSQISTQPLTAINRQTPSISTTLGTTSFQVTSPPRTTPSSQTAAYVQSTSSARTIPTSVSITPSSGASSGGSGGAPGRVGGLGGAPGSAGGSPASNAAAPMETNGLGVYRGATRLQGVNSLLLNVAATKRSPTSAMVSHYMIQPVFDVYANTQGRDLGGVASDVQKVIDNYKKKVSPGTLIYMRGQASSMNRAFSDLLFGMLFALVLIYLLLVVNFQSWLDPLIILMAIPGALSGIVWALFITQTTFSVPALMGAIMSIGVGSANSILIVNFANEQVQLGDSPRLAASKSGWIRFRPVLITAIAMIVGMLPMASGLGEGGGQNAPLGRAVIGGLVVATVSTLLFVPVVYALLKRRKDEQHS